MKTKDKEETKYKETNWTKCLGSASLALTLLAVGLIWLVNKIDE